MRGQQQNRRGRVDVRAISPTLVLVLLYKVAQARGSNHSIAVVIEHSAPIHNVLTMYSVDY